MYIPVETGTVRVAQYSSQRKRDSVTGYIAVSSISRLEYPSSLMFFPRRFFLDRSVRASHFPQATLHHLPPVFATCQVKSNIYPPPIHLVVSSLQISLALTFHFLSPIHRAPVWGCCDLNAELCRGFKVNEYPDLALQCRVFYLG